MNNLNEKFEIGWAKTVSCLQCFIDKVPNLTLTFDPVPKIYRVPPLIMNNVYIKFESDGAKTVVSILSTRQSAKDARTHSRTHSLT